MLQIKTLWSLGLWWHLSLVGCTGQSQFTGPATPKDPEQSRTDSKTGVQTGASGATPEGSDPENGTRGGGNNVKRKDGTQVPVSEPGPCTDEGLTKVRLLSPSVVSGDPQNHLDYEISAVDCAGNPLSNLKGAIDFDIGAVTTISLGGLTYTTIDGGVQRAGRLDAIGGQDLFGNSGPEYQFFRTSEVIELNNKTKTIQFRIELGGSTIESYTSQGGDGATVATYLRFGSAAAVEQSVKLIAAPTP